MKVRFAVAFLLLLAVSGAAAAQDLGEVGPDLSQASFRNHALPVLVRVDKVGHVTDIHPAIRLRPAMGRMLRKTLEQMIAAPAMHDGHPVSSQFVIQLELKASKRADGKYEVRFAYVSSMPVPSGPLYWVRTADDRLALAMPPSSDTMFRPGGGQRHIDVPQYHPPVMRGGSPNPPSPPPTAQSQYARVAYAGGSRPR